MARWDTIIVYYIIYRAVLVGEIWNFLVIFTIIMSSSGCVSHSVPPVGWFHHLWLYLLSCRQVEISWFFFCIGIHKSEGSMLQWVLMWPRSSLSTCGVEYSHHEYSRGVCHVYTSLLLYKPCYRWDTDHLICNCFQWSSIISWNGRGEPWLYHIHMANVSSQILLHLNLHIYLGKQNSQKCVTVIYRYCYISCKVTVLGPNVVTWLIFGYIVLAIWAKSCTQFSLRNTELKAIRFTNS